MCWFYKMFFAACSLSETIRTPWIHDAFSQSTANTWQNSTFINAAVGQSIRAQLSARLEEQVSALAEVVGVESGGDDDLRAPLQNVPRFFHACPKEA